MSIKEKWISVGLEECEADDEWEIWEDLEYWDVFLMQRPYHDEKSFLIPHFTPEFLRGAQIYGNSRMKEAPNVDNVD